MTLRQYTDKLFSVNVSVFASVYPDMTDNKKSGKTSTRSGSDIHHRVIDEATRKKRQQRQLDALERDNFQDDPHAAFAHLKIAKLPTFSDGTENKRKRKTRSNADHFKQRFRKTFQNLLEELPSDASEKPSYITAVAPPSAFPPRHFCAVCGFPSDYTCVMCGTRYCTARCLATHKDTRCLKWTA